jgi:hypothetical protein
VKDSLNMAAIKTDGNRVSEDLNLIESKGTDILSYFVASSSIITAFLAEIEGKIPNLTKNLSFFTTFWSFFVKNSNFFVKNCRSFVKNSNFFVKNCRFFVKNSNFFVKNYRFFVKNDQKVVKNDEFFVKNDFRFSRVEMIVINNTLYYIEINKNQLNFNK